MILSHKFVQDVVQREDGFEVIWQPIVPPFDIPKSIREWIDVTYGDLAGVVHEKLYHLNRVNLLVEATK